MGTEKRQRQKQGRQERLAAQETTVRRDQRRRRFVTAVVVAVVSFGVLVLISQAGGGGGDGPADQAGSTTAPTTRARDSTTTTTTPASPRAFEYGTGPCPPASRPAEPVRTFTAAPQRCIGDGVDYAAVLTTSQGVLTIDLSEKMSPGTVNNFVVLARYGYYQGAPFHRVIKGFVVQGGDPVGQPPGTGGPGYTIAEEIPPAGAYRVGTVAMANKYNAQLDQGRDTTGSQFFIIVGEQEGTALSLDYTVLGTVTEGMDVVARLEATATEGNQTPADPAVLESVEIVER